MLRLALFSFAAIVFSLAVIACGGDDDATPTAAPAFTIGVSSPAAGTTAPADDSKTEPPPESPAPITVAPTAPGEVPTAPPVSSEGTPAVAPDDEGLFIGQFQGQPVDTEGCTYNPTTALVTCPGRGLYAIDPPIVGQDISCSIWLVSGVARVIQCTKIGPDNAASTTSYEILD
nr:hypothetical protein S36_0542 [uncultured bacterium]